MQRGASSLGPVTNASKHAFTGFGSRCSAAWIEPNRPANSLSEHESLLRDSGDCRLTGFVELQGAWIELALARAADAASEPAKFENLLKRAREIISTAINMPIGGPSSPTLVGCCLEARIALRCLERELAVVTKLSRRLRVATDASWFRVGNSEPTNVADSLLTRRLLRELANERCSAPGKPISIPDLVSRCWPGQRMRGDSGHRRVRELVRRLRRAGLSHVHTGADGGYLLDSSVPIEIEPDPASATGLV